MGILQDLFEERKVQMGLIFKLALECFFLLAQIIAGASLNIDEDSRQPDSFKVRPMLSIKGLAARSNKCLGTRSLELAKR